MAAQTRPEGLVLAPSQHDPAQTMERLVAAVTKRNMAVLARIDHATAAARAGLELRPTEALIFGNPKAGTPLMQEAQTMGIDLPLKMLVFQDAEGKTWILYYDPKGLAARHGIDASEPVLAAIASALAAVAEEAG